MTIQLSHNEFSQVVVAVLKRIVPAKLGVFAASLTDDACVLKGEYDAGTGIRWSVVVWLSVSDDGRKIGLTFARPELESVMCSLFSSVFVLTRDEMKAKLLSKLKDVSAQKQGVKVEGDTLWLDLGILGHSIGLGSQLSKVTMDVKRNSFCFSTVS